MEVKLTKMDCENICVGWTEHKDFEVISKWVMDLNPLEALKLARHIMMFYRDDEIINRIINYCVKLP